MRTAPLSLLRAPATALALLLVFAPSGGAQIPTTMSYQGRLLDTGGAPVADGAYDLSFRLYEVPSGRDAAVWTESQPATPVSGGLFHLLLGSVNALSLAFDRPYWLGITVGAGAELSPRIALASAPYSLNSRGIAPGVAVTRLNGLQGDVTVAAGANVAIVQDGQSLTFSATAGGGLALPYSGVVGDAGRLFDVTNTGLGGAGSFKVSNANSSEPALYARSLGTGPALVADGITEVGSLTRSGELRLVRSGVATPLISALTTAAGGRLEMHDEAGNQTAYLAADNNGTGGFMDVRRDATHSGFIVDGNGSGTGEPRVDVLGSARFAAFDMGAPGDDSVQLPMDALAAGELLDEPGVAYAADGVTAITLDGTTQTLLSRSLTVPTAGFVIASGSLVGQALHTLNTSDAVIFGLGTAAGVFASGRVLSLVNPSSLATATYYYPVSVQGVFAVPAGTSTFYLLGDEAVGSWRAREMQLTLLFVPTAYGTVASPVAQQAPASFLEPAAGTGR